METESTRKKARISEELSLSVPSRSITIPKRLEYLVTYYRMFICPHIVAFDSPTNPLCTDLL